VKLEIWQRRVWVYSFIVPSSVHVRKTVFL
jgi:hypothetical protein